MRDWKDIIEKATAISQEELASFIKENIENDKISIEDKINNISFARLYLQFLFFGDKDNEASLATNLDTVELWRHFFCRRDFQILGDYFNAPINYDCCTYENWIELKDMGFIDEAYEIIGRDAKEYYDYFNQIINLDTIINSYEIYNTIVETLKSIPSGADLEEAIKVFKENQDWLKEIENFDIITK